MATSEHQMRDMRVRTAAFAQQWENPSDTLRIEAGRYPTERALAGIVRGVFGKHVKEGDSIVEVGTGQGYLRRLIPAQYHTRLLSSDYNVTSLQSGRQRQPELVAVAASAIELPHADNSVDVIVDLDAYDTLPHLQPALDEVARVLRPGGKYIHLQRDMPADNMLFLDYPDMVFFPTGRGRRENPYVTGMTPEALQMGMLMFMNPALRNYREVLRAYLEDPVGSYFEALMRQDLPRYSDFLGDLVDLVSGDKLAIPSMHEYFRDKLRDTITTSGLQIVESGYQEASEVFPRSESQMDIPEANVFIAKNGKTGIWHNPLLDQAGVTSVIETSNILVVVAQKPETRHS